MDTHSTHTSTEIHTPNSNLNILAVYLGDYLLNIRSMEVLTIYTQMTSMNVLNRYKIVMGINKISEISQRINVHHWR